jgi:FdhD protein
MAVGFLICEGLVENFDGIASVCMENGSLICETRDGKAARAGFPILASRSAPVNSGVELAQKIGMTLVGFVRSPNLHMYAGEERII